MNDNGQVLDVLEPRLNNGSPGETVFVAVDLGLAQEMRACAFNAICYYSEVGALHAFVDRRRVVIVYRNRQSISQAYYVRGSIEKHSHPASIGVIDLEHDMLVNRGFAAWWADEVSEGNYDNGTEFIDRAQALADKNTRPEVEPDREPETEPWPELGLEQAPDVLPFPTEIFPAALQRYCLGAAKVTLAPPDVVGAAMLAVASAAIGQSVNIYLKRTWHESPLLNMLIVALPGQSKTPPMKLVVKPLTTIDGDLRKASKLEREAWEELKKTAPKGVNIGPEPHQRRAVVKDITRETLVTILADNPRGVLADPDEATGWVGSFNQYKGKGNDRQFWLDIWSSRPTSVDREGGRRSAWVPCPMVTVLGGLPPDMLGTLAEEQGRNDGFFDRLLFSYPGTFPNQQWTEDELDEGDESTWDSVLNTLHKVEMYFDKEKNVCRPYLVNFDPAAKDVWVKWFNPHCKEMESEDAPAWQAGVWSKLRSYCARFCLILSRLRLATGVDSRGELARAAVTAEDVYGAIKLVDYFKSHVAKVQNRITGGTGSPDAQAILAWIQRKGLSEFREHNVLDDLRRRFATEKAFRQALEALREAGTIRPKIMHAEPVKRGRKPSPTWEVNPALSRPLEKLY